MFQAVRKAVKVAVVTGLLVATAVFAQQSAPALVDVPAAPAAPQQAVVVQGQGLSLTSIQLFFAANGKTTVLAPGVTLSTASSDKSPFSVSANWTTGSSSGSSVVNK